MKTKVYLYSRFNRFWHWSQSLLILFLILTGFEIHSSFALFGYENAVEWHELAAWGFIILVIFAVFWHILSGQWRQYIPTRRNMTAQLDYYLLGIFHKAPHPVRKSSLSKLNPLQRVVYLGLNILVIPVMIGSGLGYVFFPAIAHWNLFGIEGIALIHTAGAFMILVFLLVHLYLITTGHTPLSNLKAMLTGYEILSAEHADQETVTDKNPETDVNTKLL
jgi:thiosulfate reductase cytochrome b subunit